MANKVKPPKGDPSVNPPALVLAQPGDPYITARGERIYPELPVKPVDTSAPKDRARDFKPTRRRTVKELPTTAEMMKGLSCVLVFTMMGLGDREVADALGIHVGDVRRMRGLDAYGETFEALANEYVNANSVLVNARIAAFGNTAVTNVMHLANNGKKEEVKLRANVDLLDRGGFSSKENAQRAVMNRNDLRIVIVSGGESSTVNIDTGSFDHGQASE